MNKDELIQFVINWTEKHDEDELYTVDDNIGSVYIQLQEY